VKLILHEISKLKSTCLPSSVHICTQGIIFDLSNLGIRLQVQSVLESVPIYYRFTKTLKGILLTIRIDEL